MENNNEIKPGIIKLTFLGEVSTVTEDKEMIVPPKDELFGYDVIVTLNAEGHKDYFDSSSSTTISHFLFYNLTEVHLFWCKISNYQPWDCAFESSIHGSGCLRASNLIESVEITKSVELHEDYCNVVYKTIYLEEN